MKKITPSAAKRIEKQLAREPGNIIVRFDLITFLWRNQRLGKNARQHQKAHAQACALDDLQCLGISRSTLASIFN